MEGTLLKLGKEFDLGDLRVQLVGAAIKVLFALHDRVARSLQSPAHVGLKGLAIVLRLAICADRGGGPRRLLRRNGFFKHISAASIPVILLLRIKLGPLELVEVLIGLDRWILLVLVSLELRRLSRRISSVLVLRMMLVLLGSHRHRSAGQLLILVRKLAHMATISHRCCLLARGVRVRGAGWRA